MNKEEIKQLSDRDLGKILAKRCGVEFTRNGGVSYLSNKIDKKCWGSIYLCSDLNKIAKIEQLLFKEKLDFEYEWQSSVLDILGCAEEHKKDWYRWYAISEIAHLTARERAEVCLLALEKYEKNNNN